MLPSAVRLHVPDWQLVAAPKHGPAPSVRPHLPFDASHTFATHWFAFVQLVVVFGPAQVFVTALHWPERHVAAAFAALHAPLWRPSFGMESPRPLSSPHVSALRLQCFAAGQSAST